MKSLNKGIAVGAMWLLSLKFFMRGLGIISTFVLVRLLSPEDFGLNSIAMSIFGFVDILSRFGFDTVLIQNQEASRQHYDTAWTFNVLFGVVSCVLILLASPLIADFYGNQNLLPVLVAVSLLFLLNGFLNVGIVDFRKNLTFEKEFKLQILPKLISFVVTIIIALCLRNYWALVVGTLVWKGSICFFSYTMHPYRPRISFDAGKELFNFSKWIMISNFIRFFNRKSPELLIGKLLSTSAAGFMSIGSEISTFATSELVSNVNRAAYPGYSKVSHDLSKLKDLYLGVMASISFWVFPAGVGLSSVASILVPVMLGSQWIEVTGLIEYLAIANLLFALNSNAVYVFLAIAKPHISAYVSLIRVLIFIPLLIFFMNKNGILGAAQATFIASATTFIVYNFVIVTKLKFPTFDVLKIHIRPLVCSSIMGGVLFFLKSFVVSKYNASDFVVLVVCVFIGVFIYALSTLIIWSVIGFPDGPEKSILNILNKKLFKRFGSSSFH